MKRELTSHERMLAAIQRQPVDHIPLGQVFHSTVLGTPTDQQWRDQFERAQVMKDLGLDPVIDIWLPTPEPPPSVRVRKWTEADPDGPDPLLCAEYQTPVGRLVQKVRRTPDWYHPTHYKFLNDWTGDTRRPRDRFDEIDMMDDWFTKRYKVPLVKGPEDLEAFSYVLKAPTGATRDTWIANACEAKRRAQAMGLLTHARRVSIGDWFMWVCLIEDFCVAQVENPDYISRFYDIINQYNQAIVDLALEVAPDIIQYRGWYDTPDYWGPKRLKEVLVPRIEQLARQVHDGGSLFCYLLPEGYTLYRDILAEMRVEVFFGLEPLAAKKSEDFALVKGSLGKQHSIWGGVNAPVTVGMGTDDEIDAAVRTAIETLGPTGFILNAAIYLYDDDVAWDRFMVFVKAWQKYA
jgi:hypothetical protein